MQTDLPIWVTGAISPYPTDVNVTEINQNPFQTSSRAESPTPLSCTLNEIPLHTIKIPIATRLVLRV